MHHHRRAEAVEEARLGHRDLAAATLLGRGADNLDRSVHVGDGPAQGDPGAHRPGADQIVAAGVAQPRQRIILGQDANDWLTTTIGCDEGGIEAGDAALDLEAVLLEFVGQCRHRLVLLECDLRVGVHPLGDLNQPRLECPRFCCDPLFDVRDRLCCDHAFLQGFPTAVVGFHASAF